MTFQTLTINHINKAFSPSLEITNPDIFAGRSELIKDGLVALQNPGGFIAVIGQRGVGKSSIGKQLSMMASGDRRLVDKMRLSKYYPGSGLNYIVQYIRSDGFVNNIGDLVKRIMFGDENGQSLFSLTKSGDRRLTEFKKVLEGHGSVSFGNSSLGASGSQEEVYKIYTSDDFIQQFRNLLGVVKRDNPSKNGLLIMVDEFDTIKDKRGFSSLVKACSDEFLKFGVVGIAGSMSELMNDHKSIGRQIDILKAELMTPQELQGIIENAELQMNREIRFAATAANGIVEKSEGFPYFIHLLGKELSLNAFEGSSDLIDDAEMKALFVKISDGRLRTIYEDIYQLAVGNSQQREMLLKLFSECKTEEMFTEEIYEQSRGLGVGNPSQYMKQLTAPDSPGATPALTKVRERYYRFSDPVFKVYARIRQWKY